MKNPKTTIILIEKTWRDSGAILARNELHLDKIYIIMYKCIMLRTQIYLPADHIKYLRIIAQEENISVSEAIRRVLDNKVKEDIMPKGKKMTKNVGSWLLALASKAKKLNIKGPSNLASKMDKYLYGNM